jgi:hypothetical protein
MDPLEFLRTAGDEATEAMCLRAGTTLAYFRQIAYRFRRPSAQLAKALERESGGVLKAASMLMVDLRSPGEQQAAPST